MDNYKNLTMRGSPSDARFMMMINDLREAGCHLHTYRDSPSATVVHVRADQGALFPILATDYFAYLDAD